MKTGRQNKTDLKISVLGGGSFGTVIANLCALNGYSVQLWVRSVQQAHEINSKHINARYLPNFKLSKRIKAVTDLLLAGQSADVIFWAIPSTAFREIVKVFSGKLIDKTLISLTKGIESSSFYVMTEILKEELPNNQIGALSGPNLAKELINKALTASVIASDNPTVCQLTQKILQSAYFRIYASNDPYGVQLGGALKNIYAIASGLASSMSTGENTRSMLITRALAEMSRFAAKLGANPITFLGLAGVGDLIVTCTSDLSRNFRVGEAFGQGKSLPEIEGLLGQVAEGVNTLRLVKKKADELCIDMPIMSGLYAVLFENRSVLKMLYHEMIHHGKYDLEFTFE